MNNECHHSWTTKKDVNAGKNLDEAIECEQWLKNQMEDTVNLITRVISEIPTSVSPQKYDCGNSGF